MSLAPKRSDGFLGTAEAMNDGFTPLPIPTMREEVTFKAIQTYERILDDCVNGSITLAQADYAVKTLLAAVGWCIERSSFVMISEWVTEYDDTFLTKRLFFSPYLRKVFTVVKAPHKSLVLVFSERRLVKKTRCLSDDLETTFNNTCAMLMTGKHDCRELTWPIISKKD